MSNNSQIPISDWLKKYQSRFKTAGIDSYNLDAIILLEYVTKRDRAVLLAHPETTLKQAELRLLDQLASRRMNREPIAYITNTVEFYGRDFFVDKNVLIPRPESEAFITLAKKHNITHETILDVGSGSGILGITLKLELPQNKVTLLDLDPTTLRIARKNTRKLGADCLFIQADLLPQAANYTVIVANLPYVPKNMELAPELAYEPSLALFADNGGMSLYKALWQKIASSKSCRYVLTESLPQQHQTQSTFAKTARYALVDTDGLVQLFKFIG